MSSQPHERLGLSVHDVLTTTRSVRRRLDLDRPVDDELIKECLEYAVQAPTGSNRQGWRFVVVTDPEKRAGLADLYRQGWERYVGMAESAAALATDENSESGTQQMRVMRSAAYLAENMHRVPAMVIPCLPGRIDRSGFGATSSLASIIPSAWSFMLGARERGLGTCWTTIHLMFEEEASTLLNIPYETVSQVALITVGHTIGTDFQPATREGGADAVTSWNGWEA
ncbi:MAG: nitroreductase [Acidimicrobiaceae bacterium]|nr:nitroreductase [Acidimicrobiaceae bacterium]